MVNIKNLKTLGHADFWTKISCTLLISTLPLLSFAAENQDNILNSSQINKLSSECQAGNKEACARLTEIAKNDKDWTFRMAAVEKITDQKVLADIAKNDKNSLVRETAAENRQAALGKITDQKILVDIVMNDRDNDLRLTAIEKLTNQSVLAYIAQYDDNSLLKASAEARLDKLRKNK